MISRDTITNTWEARAFPVTIEATIMYCLQVWITKQVYLYIYIYVRVRVCVRVNYLEQLDGFFSQLKPIASKYISTAINN